MIPENSTVEINGQQFAFSITYLQPLALERAINSNLFKDDELQALLFIARKMHHYNLMASILVSGMNTKNTDLAKMGVLSLSETKKALLKDFEMYPKLFPH